MLPPFRIRRLWAADNPAGPDCGNDYLSPDERMEDGIVVHMAANQYDDIVSTNPSAALKYMDDDDGETVTVGTALELSQRLDEPAPRIPMVSEMPDAEDSVPLHTFEVDQSPNVLRQWRSNASPWSTRRTINHSFDPVAFQNWHREWEKRYVEPYCVWPPKQADSQQREIASEDTLNYSGDRSLFSLESGSSSQAAFQNERTQPFKASDPPRDVACVEPHTGVIPPNNKEGDRSEPEQDELARETTPLLRVDTIPSQPILTASTSLTSEGIRQAKEAGFKIRSNIRPSYTSSCSTSANLDTKEHQNRWASYGRTKSPFGGESSNYTSVLSTSLTAEGIRQAKEAGARIRSNRSPVYHSPAATDEELDKEEHQSRWASYGRTKSPFAGDPTDFINELSKNAAGAVKANVVNTNEVFEPAIITERENPFSERMNPNIEVQHDFAPSILEDPKPYAENNDAGVIESPLVNTDGASHRSLLEIFEAELAKLVENTPTSSNAPAIPSSEPQSENAHESSSFAREPTAPARGPSPALAAPAPDQQNTTPGDLFALGFKSMVDGFSLLASQVNLPETQQQLSQIQQELPNALEQAVRGTIGEVGTHIQQAASTMQASARTPDAAADEIRRAERQLIDGAIGGFRDIALEAAEFGKGLFSSLRSATQQPSAARPENAAEISESSLQDAFLEFLTSGAQDAEGHASASAISNPPESIERKSGVSAESHDCTPKTEKTANLQPSAQTARDDKISRGVQTAANRSERVSKSAPSHIRSDPFPLKLQEDGSWQERKGPERRGARPAELPKDKQPGSKPSSASNGPNHMPTHSPRQRNVEIEEDKLHEALPLSGKELSRLERENDIRRFGYAPGCQQHGKPRAGDDLNDSHKVAQDRHYKNESSPIPSPPLAYEYVDPRHFVHDNLYDNMSSPPRRPLGGPRAEPHLHRRSTSPTVGARQSGSWPRVPKHGPIHLSEEPSFSRYDSGRDQGPSFWRPTPKWNDSIRNDKPLHPLARPQQSDFPKSPMEYSPFPRGPPRSLHHRQSWHPSSQHQWMPRPFSPHPFAPSVEKETATAQVPQQEPVRPSRLRHHCSIADPLNRRSENLDRLRTFNSEDRIPRRELSATPLRDPKEDSRATWNTRHASNPTMSESKDGRSLISENGSEFPADDTDPEDVESTHIKPPWGYERLDEDVEPFPTTDVLANLNNEAQDRRNNNTSNGFLSNASRTSTLFDEGPRVEKRMSKAIAVPDHDYSISEMSRFPSLSQFESGSFEESKPFPALPSMEPLTPQNIQESAPSRNPFSTPRQRSTFPFPARASSPLPGSRLACPFDPLADSGLPSTRFDERFGESSRRISGQPQQDSDSQEESLYDSFVRTVEHPANGAASIPRTREAAIDYCVQRLLIMGYRSNEDRLSVYAQATDGNLEEAIQMIEDERKAYQSRGVLTL